MGPRTGWRGRLPSFIVTLGMPEMARGAGPDSPTPRAGKVPSGLAGRVRYAQLLNDGSELAWRDTTVAVHPDHHARPGESDVVIELPTKQPPVEAPVIELTLLEKRPPSPERGGL